jgi:hypothetical protein
MLHLGGPQREYPDECQSRTREPLQRAIVVDKAEARISRDLKRRKIHHTPCRAYDNTRFRPILDSFVMAIMKLSRTRVRITHVAAAVALGPRTCHR